MLKVAVIGKDGRSSAILKSLRASKVVAEVRVLSQWKDKSASESHEEVIQLARAFKPDLVIIGPEEPLAAGIVDDLWNLLGIPCVGPFKDLARLESSKAFTRNLVAKYGIPGNPVFRAFDSLDGVQGFLEQLPGYVVKPDGLTGGKGVKVSDAHLFSVADALAYCDEVLKSGHQQIVIEEKLFGEEFSLMSFCDGETTVDMVVVQDHKRLGEGDSGPNTGGMGSYSCANGSLPFLSEGDLQTASEINAAVARAVKAETGLPYKGILYGGFMVTADGVKLLEYNARLGDPEAMNVLSLLETDFGVLCHAITQGTLDTVEVRFKSLASVCKYVVPQGYPDNGVKGETISLNGVREQVDRLLIYPAAVQDVRSDSEGNLTSCVLTGSRAVGFVGLGATLEEAEQIAEQAASAVTGPVYHRRDIGTKELVEARIENIESLKRTGKSYAAKRPSLLG
jgi:phosphoribosylamine--glycine ligase